MWSARWPLHVRAAPVTGQHDETHTIARDGVAGGGREGAQQPTSFVAGGAVDGAEAETVSLHPLSLSFSDPDVERSFRAEYAAKSLKWQRWSIGLAGVLYAAFGLLDLGVAPEHVPLMWAVRFLVVCPLASLALVLSFTPSGRRYTAQFAWVLCLLGGLGILAMVASLSPPTSYLYGDGVYLVTSCVYTFFRLRFRPAAALAWGLGFTYEITTALLGSTSTALLLGMALFLFGFNVIGMAACYWQERAARLDFLDKKVLASIQDKMQQREIETRQLAMVARRTTDGVIITDARNRILWVNEGFTRMTGYTLEESLGQMPPQLLRTAEGDPEQGKRIHQAVLSGQGITTETASRHKDGSRYWASLDIQPVFDERGVLTHQVAISRETTDHHEAEEALRYQALHDALTGLPNRSLLRDRLDLALKACERNNESLALLLVDLDRFKEVNDTLGHPTGDRLLQALADRLRSVVRSSDTVARLGGDEFAVLLPGADAEGGRVWAESVLSLLGEPVIIDGEAIIAGASIGIASAPSHGSDADTLLRRADVAMYAAKRQRSGYVIYSVERDAHSPARLQLRTALHGAAQRNELVLFYQPKLDLATGLVTGVEALVRWQHPERGLLGPDHFIDIAEETGLIEPIGRWIVGASIAQAAAWRDQGLEVPVAVNVSARQLQDPALAGTIADELAAQGLLPRFLSVEITESSIMADPEHTREVLRAIDDSGIRVSIDDFGTGYSSLSRLKRMPVSELKVDRGFVRNMARDAGDQAIVRATVEMAHALGLTVVAEGVEDEATLATLRSLRCDEAQGYYFCRPRPADDLSPWLAQHSKHDLVTRAA